jgi:hypothetical protein
VTEALLVVRARYSRTRPSATACRELPDVPMVPAFSMLDEMSSAEPVKLLIKAG